MTCDGNLQILNIKRHDTLPRVKGRLVESDPDDPGNAVPVNITGATIKFVMVTDDNARTIKVNAAAVITVPTNGEFEYRWTGTDTNTTGNYVGEFEIAFPAGGGKVTVPPDDTLKIRIFDDFDNA
jgi:hypothetical protein